MNGDEPPSVYGLWWNSGYPNYFAYDFSNEKQTFSGSSSLDIGHHAILFGFEYEKRKERYYRVYTDNLWSIARQLVNQHLSNPQYYVDDQVQWDFDEDVLIFSTFSSNCFSLSIFNIILLASKRSNPINSSGT